MKEKIPMFKILLIIRKTLSSVQQKKAEDKVNIKRPGDLIESTFIEGNNDIPSKKMKGIERKILERNFSIFYFVGFTLEEVERELKKSPVLNTKQIFLCKEVKFIEVKEKGG